MRLLPSHYRYAAPKTLALSVAAVITVFVSALSFGSTSHPATAQSMQLRTLTSVGAVHILSYAEASRSYPVHVRAVIVYYDPFLNYPRRPVIMVADSTASIYVGLVDPPSPSLKAGVLVEVTGVSNPGDFGPSISNAHIRVVGTAPLPPRPPRQSLTHLLTGSEDAQWVEVEAVVKSFEVNGGNVTLKLALADGELAATSVKETGADYASLVDAKVLIHGIAGSLFNLQGQIFSEQLLFPSLAALRVEQPAPAVFQLPVSPIRSLMQYHLGLVYLHRVHIRGTVTLFWPGRMLCVQDGDSVKDDSDALCAGTAQTSALEPGDFVDIAGFPQIGPVRPTLSDAEFVRLPRTGPLFMASIDAGQAFTAVHDAQLVQIEGIVIAHDRASADPTIVVSAGNYTFPVALSKSADSRGLLALQEGTRLRLIGICSVQADTSIRTRHDGYPIVSHFQIMLRSSSDVQILEMPSWWSAEHTLRVLTAALIITMLVLVWSGFLRVRLKQQTRMLQYQATHDGLTGIWNRGAICDLLRREFEQAARANQRVGVMMLDADHFKRINDTHGHLAGDAVLKELARRIQEAVRSYDLTGRYGGEEFLIILPGCFGDELSLCAERVRAAIAGEPITAEGTLLEVTVSVGTAVLDPTRNGEKDALANADSALYQAKHLGRNRVVSGDVQPTPTLS